MLHISTKMLGLPPKITKMLDNAHHTEAFSYFFQREKKNRIKLYWKSNNVFMVLIQKNKIIVRKRLF